MCGRYSLGKDADQLKQDFPGFEVLRNLAARYNIGPSQPVAAWIADPNPRMELFTWGLVPHWTRDPALGSRLINARVETVTEKPSFRGSFRRKRCLIPVDGTYEWKNLPSGRKQPWYFCRKDRRAYALAGLWDEWHDPGGSLVLSCAILTTRPNQLARTIHHRMPAILREEDYHAWLDPNLSQPQDLLPLLEPVASDDFQVYPVSPRVNRLGVEGPECVQEVPPPGNALQGELF